MLTSSILIQNKYLLFFIGRGRTGCQQSSSVGRKVKTKLQRLNYPALPVSALCFLTFLLAQAVSDCHQNRLKFCRYLNLGTNNGSTR